MSVKVEKLNFFFKCSRSFVKMDPSNMSVVQRVVAQIQIFKKL